MTSAAAAPPVRYSVGDGVAHVELDRPDAYNAVDIALAEELERCLRQAGENDDVRAVLLSGRGRSFCAGGDVKAMAAAADRTSYVSELVSASHRAVIALVECPKPTVVAVHGSAAGAGFGYACAADLVVAAESAKFLSAFIAVGLTPDSSTSWFLPKLVGHHRALELTLLNRVLNAHDARDWGLVNAVHPDEELLDAARTTAIRLAEAPEPALTRTRRLVRADADAGLADHLAEEAASIVASVSTPSAKRLLAQFATR